MKCSRFTFPFSFFKSTHILTFPFFFMTGTIGAHHSVGSVTFSMIPSRSMRMSSSSTFGSMGNGTRRGVLMQYGFASSRSVIFTGLHLTKPHEPKTLTSSTRFTRFIRLATFRPNKLLACAPAITKILKQ